MSATKKNLTIREAAERLGIGTQYVYVLLASRKLPGEKVDGRWVVDQAAVEERANRLRSRYQTA